MRPRIHLQFWPTSWSWLNAVEGRSSQLERRALYLGVFTSVPELKAELLSLIKFRNEHSAKPLKWTKPAGKIIAKTGRARLTSHN